MRENDDIVYMIFKSISALKSAVVKPGGGMRRIYSSYESFSDSELIAKYELIL